MGDGMDTPDSADLLRYWLLYKLLWQLGSTWYLMLLRLAHHPFQRPREGLSHGLSQKQPAMGTTFHTTLVLSSKFMRISLSIPQYIHIG